MELALRMSASGNGCALNIVHAFHESSNNVV
jgi:hypothetical protein